MHDGTMKKIEYIEDLVPGCVIRRVNDDGTIAPFSDTIVLGHADKYFYFKLARPYGYATLTETICQGHLLGAETYIAKFDVLKESFMLVLYSTGYPVIMKT